MKTFTVTKTHEITAEEIDDIMTTALEGGITYWCGEVRVREHFEPKEDYNYASEVISRGGVLQLWDSEEEKWLNLDIDRLLQGLSESNFFYDNYDAGNVDEVIQKAVFGEVVYG